METWAFCRLAQGGRRLAPMHLPWTQGKLAGGSWRPRLGGATHQHIATLAVECCQPGPGDFSAAQCQ